MRKLMAPGFLLAVLAVASFAADVNGKWVAQTQGRNGQTREVTFNLKANGSALTGSVTTPRGDIPISDGKVDGNKISFSQIIQFGGNEVKLMYTGVVSGDEIKFTRSREGGEGRTQEFTAKRSS